MPQTASRGRPPAAAAKRPRSPTGKGAGGFPYSGLLEKGIRGLLFLFFLGSPLVFVPGYIDGQLFCTLYNLPKFWFIMASVFLLAGAALLQRATAGELCPAREKPFWRSPTARLLLLFIGWMGLSLGQAELLPRAATTWAAYLVMGLFWLTLVRLLRLPARRRAAVAGLLCGLLVFLIPGLYQAAGGKLPFLIPIRGPASTFGYRNPAGHFIVLVFPFLFFTALVAWRRWRRRCRNRDLGLTIALVLLGLAVILHLALLSCRVAFLALAVQALLLPLLAAGLRPGVRGLQRPPSKALALAVAGVILIVSLVFVFPQSRRRVLGSWHRLRRGGIAFLLEARYYHWGNTLMMIRAHPLLGVGPGNFEPLYPLYSRTFVVDPLMNYRFRIRKSHNDYLQVVAECGIPAGLLLLLLLARQLQLLARPGGRPEEGWPEEWRLPLAGSLSAMMLIELFSFPLQMAYSRMFFFFLLALGEARVAGVGCWETVR